MTTTTMPGRKTGTLHMMRAEINLPEFRRWMGGKRLQDEDHAIHCLLTECFGRDLAPKPFRFIIPRGGSKAILYGYGTSDAESLRETALICADPLQGRIMPLAKLDSKAMPETWKVGLKLGFEVRIRPIVRCGRGSDRPGKERDAFQAEAMRYPKGGMNRCREHVYTEWLSNQLERIDGATLDTESTKLVSFQRTRSYRKRRGNKYSEGPDALMRGVITITNSEAFSCLLARGVGRHRAYGYGMLLLRPVGSLK